MGTEMYTIAMVIMGSSYVSAKLTCEPLDVLFSLLGQVTTTRSSFPRGIQICAHNYATTATTMENTEIPFPYHLKILKRPAQEN